MRALLTSATPPASSRNPDSHADQALAKIVELLLPGRVRVHHPGLGRRRLPQDQQRPPRDHRPDHQQPRQPHLGVPLRPSAPTSIRPGWSAWPSRSWTPTTPGGEPTVGMERRIPPRRDRPLRPTPLWLHRHHRRERRRHRTRPHGRQPHSSPTGAPSTFPTTVNSPGTPAHPTIPTAESPSPASPPPSAAPSPEPTTRPPTPSPTHRAHRRHISRTAPRLGRVGGVRSWRGAVWSSACPNAAVSSWLRGGRPLSHPKGTGGRVVSSATPPQPKAVRRQTRPAVGETMDNLPRRPQVFQGFPPHPHPCLSTPPEGQNHAPTCTPYGAEAQPCAIVHAI